MVLVLPIGLDPALKLMDLVAILIKADSFDVFCDFFCLLLFIVFVLSLVDA
jgi:hypothetical protein